MRTAPGLQGGVAAAKLDLSTLNARASEKYLVSPEKNSDCTVSLTVKRFPDGDIEAIAMRGGVSYENRNKKVEKKERIKDESRVHMSDHDLRRTKQRAKSSCRTLLKCMQPRQMITCTTRAAVTDSELFKRICLLFFKKFRREFPGVQYVAVFEIHDSEDTSERKRGSYHLHFAVRQNVSYNKLRHMWRQTRLDCMNDGDYEGANINGAKMKFGGSPQNIQRYMIKYLVKTLDSTRANKKMYWASRKIAPVEKVTVYVPALLNGMTHYIEDILTEHVNASFKLVFCPDRQSGLDPLIYFYRARSV